MKESADAGSDSLSSDIILSPEQLSEFERALEVINERRHREDDLADEYPEYEEFLRKRRLRFLELIGTDEPLERIDAIMKAEGFDDEKWEPERWRRENGETSPRRPPEDL